MKKATFILLTVFFLGILFFSACGGSQEKKQRSEKTETEEVDKTNEEKAREMIEKAEKMESDTTNG